MFDQRLFGFAAGAESRSVRPPRSGSSWRRSRTRSGATGGILMVLEGLIDRTPVWHPPFASGASFLSLADQDAGKIVLIQDDEESIQLGEGGRSFAQWQRRLNFCVPASGSRRTSTRRLSELYNDGDRWSRGKPPARSTSRTRSTRLRRRRCSSKPAATTGQDPVHPHREDQAEFVARAGEPRHGTLRDRGGTEAAGVLRDLPRRLLRGAVRPRHCRRDGAVPRIPGERSNHFLSMVPTLRAAIAAKHEEAAQEADFRGFIAQLLVAEGADAEDVAEPVDEPRASVEARAHMVEATQRRDGAHEKKAADQIVAEYYARRKRDADDSEERMIERGRAIPGAIAVGRDRQGRWWSYSPSPDAHDEGVFLALEKIFFVKKKYIKS